MLWSAVGRRYLKCFEQARASTRPGSSPCSRPGRSSERPADWPEIKLEHLRLMTDGTGLLQHAAFSIPRYEDGYCLDDNARALLLMTLIEDAGIASGMETRALASRYLAFVNHAFNPEKGRFRNFLPYPGNGRRRRFRGKPRPRPLGAGQRRGTGLRSGAVEPEQRPFPPALPGGGGFFQPPRLGLRAFGDRRIPARLRGRPRRAVGEKKRSRSASWGFTSAPERDDWPWFEDKVTYCNARLSQALIVSGSWMEDEP